MSSLLARFIDRSTRWSFVLALAAVACSAPEESPSTGSAGTSAGGGPASTSGSGGLAGGSGGAAPFVGGSGSDAGRSGGGTGGVAGTSTGGAQAGGGGGAGSGAGGASNGGSAGSGGGSSGNAGGGMSSACPTVKADYAAELEKQLFCNPNGSSQCTDRVAAAAGCQCLVFIEPADPFAIEHLLNLENAWFDADCSMPACPAKCSTASAGNCQADSNSPLGGRCVSP